MAIWWESRSGRVGYRTSCGQPGGDADPRYDGETGADYDTRMDRIAETCATDAPIAITDLYATEDLAVPTALLASGG